MMAFTIAECGLRIERNQIRIPQFAIDLPNNPRLEAENWSKQDCFPPLAYARGSVLARSTEPRP
jgi:hypothetical protein